MSTTKSVDDALDFYPERESRTAFRRLPTATVWAYWSAMRDGLAAARAYHQLTTQGATHETAVEKVFDRHLNAR